MICSKCGSIGNPDCCDDFSTIPDSIAMESGMVILPGLITGAPRIKWGRLK
jgi:hypothetical protein